MKIMALVGLIVMIIGIMIWYSTILGSIPESTESLNFNHINSDSIIPLLIGSGISAVGMMMLIRGTRSHGNHN